MKSTSDAAPLAAFAGCTILWGTTFLAIRFGTATLPPLWGAALRLLLAALILAPLSLALGQPFPRGAALRAAVVYGALEFGANLGLLYWAERVVPSGLAAIFYATSPLVGAIAAHLSGQERLHTGRVLGTLVAFTGVVIAFASELTARADPIALLAVLAAAVVAGLAGIALRRVPSMPVVPTNAVGCAVGGAMLVPISLLAREPITIPSTWNAWGPVLYLTAAGSLGAFVLYTFLVNRWGVARATLLGVTVPIVALIVGAIVGGERLAASTLAGGALVLVGVAIALRRD